MLENKTRDIGADSTASRRRRPSSAASEGLAAAEFHTKVTSLEGKTVLVSGGSTGIGRATAGLLASSGAHVFIFGRHGAPLRDALADLRKLGKVEGIVADVARPRGIAKVFQYARKAFGTLDILIDNAGLGGEGVADMADDEWRYVVETNLTGAMACAREALVWMRDRSRGHIVIVGSISAERKGKDSSVYVATKSGLRGFAESLHKEARGDGIKVTPIEPGQVGSDMQEASPRQQRRKIRKKEMLRAEDIAVGVHYALTQPPRCDVTFMQIRPHNEEE
jgi:NADP-dependent 3-hydroxy acid dehydrogenase YdfG